MEANGKGRRNWVGQSQGTKRAGEGGGDDSIPLESISQQLLQSGQQCNVQRCIQGAHNHKMDFILTRSGSDQIND